MSKYQVHEDFKNMKTSVPLYKHILPFLQPIVRYTFEHESVFQGIELIKKTILSYGNGEIPIEIYKPVNLAGPSPTLLYIHGGAFVFPAAGYHRKLICNYALHASCNVVYVDYRLVPKYPYPYALEDCYSTYEWIIGNAKEYGFMINKIGICGDSAGGALAASLTLLVKDRLARLPLFQMLIYPALDARMATQSMKDYTDTPIWNANLNRKMWELYTPKNLDLEMNKYISPANVELSRDLPSAYIEVNEFDCLRDEGIEYCNRLKRVGVDAVLNKTQGTIHGFDFNYESEYTQGIISERIEYMKKLYDDCKG